MPRKTVSTPDVSSTTTSTSDTVSSNETPAVATPTTTDQDDAALKNINYKNMLLTGNYGMLKPDKIGRASCRERV